MSTSCALALNGVDGGERGISKGTSQRYACVGSTIRHVRVDECEVAFGIRCGHTCGVTRVDMLVSAVVLHV